MVTKGLAGSTVGTLTALAPQNSSRKMQELSLWDLKIRALGLCSANGVCAGSTGVHSLKAAACAVLLGLFQPLL